MWCRPLCCQMTTLRSQMTTFFAKNEEMIVEVESFPFRMAECCTLMSWL